MGHEGCHEQNYKGFDLMAEEDSDHSIVIVMEKNRER
jgi:hypothetical protein